MKYFPFLLALAATILISSGAASTIVKEYPIGSLEGDITVSQARECVETNFLALDQNNQQTILLSIYLGFQPDKYIDANVEIKINDILFEKFLAKELNETNHVEVQYNWMLPGQYNRVEICVEAGKEAEITLKKSTRIGYYVIPKLEITKRADKTNVKINELIKVNIVLKNNGLEGVQVVLKGQNTKTEMPEVAYIRGETQYNGFIGVRGSREETIKLEYYVKPKKDVEMSLPASTVEYVNDFGEKKVIKSNRPKIFVEKNAPFIEATLVKEEINLVGEPTKITLFVSNTGKEEARDLNITLEPPETLESQGIREKMAVLKEGETIEYKTIVQAKEAEEYILGECFVAYKNPEGEIFKSDCKNNKIFFEEKKFDMDILFTMLLALIGIGIFVYLKTKK